MDAVTLALPFLIALILVALAFDFLNGLHDAANSIATIVSTRVLRPQYAVAWAAFFNFIAFLFFGAHVAQTIGVGIVSADVIVATSALVQEAMPLLSSINTHAGRISSISEQISQLEGRADELHDVGLRELYQASLPSSSMAFFVGVEIYDHLEKVVDRFDDVGNEIHGIMLENV